MKTKFKSASNLATLACGGASVASVAASLLLCAVPQIGWAGSLWRESVTDERGMFSDKRAHRLGDIVTITIAETAASTNSETLTNTRSNAGTAGLATNLINQLINAGANQQSAVPAGDRRKFFTNLLPKPAGQAPAILAPATTTNYTGLGTLDNKQEMTASMSVQVIDVLPNKNLVIEGIRQIGFSKERQFMSLRGIIRPDDVLLDNTVPSSKVADARIDVVSEGSISESQKKGWLLRMDEKISPY
jgi:flagellar L-ring protein precursor FlgH